MADEPEAFMTPRRRIALFATLAISSFIIITHVDDEMVAVGSDAMPDSASTMAMAPRDVRSVVDSAVELEHAGRFAAALDRLEHAVLLNQRDARAATELATCYRWMHRYGDAAVAAQNALVLAPSSVAAVAERVAALAGNGDVRLAREILAAVPASDSLRAALDNADVAWIEGTAPSAGMGTNDGADTAVGDDAMRRAREEEARARALSQGGDAAAAVGIVTRLLNSPSPLSRSALRRDPRWATVRGSAQFHELAGAP